MDRLMRRTTITTEPDPRSLHEGSDGMQASSEGGKPSLMGRARSIFGGGALRLMTAPQNKAVFDKAAFMLLWVRPSA